LPVKLLKFQLKIWEFVEVKLQRNKLSGFISVGLGFGNVIFRFLMLKEQTTLFYAEGFLLKKELSFIE